LPGPATPLPKPALATVPRTPLAPPVPLPSPGPLGKSKEPSFAICTPVLLVCLPTGTPFGSPKPPVCTWLTLACSVGLAELPEETPVSIAFVGLPRATGAGFGLLSNLPTSRLGCGLGDTGAGTGGGSTFATAGGGGIPRGFGISILGAIFWT